MSTRFLVIQDVHLHPFVDPDPLYNIGSIRWL